MSKYKKIKLKNGSTIDEHRLVWMKAHGEIPEGMVVHHKNGIKDDNRLDNLELAVLHEHSRRHIIKRGNEHLRRPITHGTTNGYRKGCRCSKCKEHHRIRNKKRRERVGKSVAIGPDEMKLSSPSSGMEPGMALALFFNK